MTYMVDRPYLEDNRYEGEAIGICQWCKGDIMNCEDHYNFDGVYVHDECIIDYNYQFKIIV